MIRHLRAGALALALFCVLSTAALPQSEAPPAPPDLTPPYAFHQPQCLQRPHLMALLRHTYRERAEALGMIGDKGAVEVMLSERGSFSVVFSFPNGTSCLMAAGHGWQRNPQSPASDLQ